MDELIEFESINSTGRGLARSHPPRLLLFLRLSLFPPRLRVNPAIPAGGRPFVPRLINEPSQTLPASVSRLSVPFAPSREPAVHASRAWPHFLPVVGSGARAHTARLTPFQTWRLIERRSAVA